MDLDENFYSNQFHKVNKKDTPKITSVCSILPQMLMLSFSRVSKPVILFHPR